MIFGAPEQVDIIEDVRIPTREGSVAGRVYRGSAAAEVEGAVAVLSRWWLGRRESRVRRFGMPFPGRAHEPGDRVGRLSAGPEHPFPAAVHDAVDAYRWLRSHPQWGTTVAVAGTARREPRRAVVCAETLDDENGPPDFQLLFFPVTDVSTKHASYRLFSDGYFLTEKQMDWYIGHYLPNPSDRTDPRASPLLGDPTGHPPARCGLRFRRSS